MHVDGSVKWLSDMNRIKRGEWSKAATIRTVWSNNKHNTTSAVSDTRSNPLQPYHRRVLRPTQHMVISNTSLSSQSIALVFLTTENRDKITHAPQKQTQTQKNVT